MSSASVGIQNYSGISECYGYSQSIEDIGQVDSQMTPVPVVSVVLYVGGNSNTNASNSVNYGLSYANANNDTSNSNTNIGSRLNLNVTINQTDLAVDSTSQNCGKQESKSTGSVAQLAKTRYYQKGRIVMRHRLTDCYSKICSMDVLRQASREACRPRKNTREVAAYLPMEEELLKELQEDLIHHRYIPGDFNIYYKEERGKMRLVADQPLYPHRIVLCAIAIVIEDDLNRTLIWQTHASIRGHGTHTAMMDTRKHLHNDPRLCYCLSMDIDQCYASMDTGKVKSMLREYIKDGDLLSLMDRIIDSYNATGHTGIALGGRLSPLLANLYLSPLDHHMKEDLHIHVMSRYMDNYFVFGYSRQWLLSIQRDVAANLAEIGLKLNANWMIVPIDETHGVDMIGWIVYSNHVLIRKKTKIRMKRTFAKAEAKLDRCQELDVHELSAIGSYVGCLKWFDSWNLC